MQLPNENRIYTVHWRHLRFSVYFKDVRVNPDIDTIVWTNEADFLYEIGENA